MKITISQYHGPDHTFESVEEYETFLKTTHEDLIYLVEVIEGDDRDRALLEIMWWRIYEGNDINTAIDSAITRDNELTLREVIAKAYANLFLEIIGESEWTT